MRAYTLSLLSKLKALDQSGTSIDQQIVTWANNKVTASQFSSILAAWQQKLLPAAAVAFGDVCLCVCLITQKLKNYWSGLTKGERWN